MNLRVKIPRPLNLLIGLHIAIFALGLFILVRQKGEPVKDNEKIVVIPIEGVISFEHGSLARGQSVDELVATLNRIKDKEEVKAVVLRINSPGGSVGAVQEIHGAIKKLKAKGKFIVSSFGDISASGGYYVASLSDKIYCQPGSLTGSIGVIMQLPNVQVLLNKVGVSFTTLKSGGMKDSGSPFRSMTETERAYFKEVLMDAYGQFFQAVKEGRKMDDATLRPLADGRIFSGQMAFKNKLVDELGSLDDAIEGAKKLAGLENKKPEIIFQKDRPSLEKLFALISKSPFEKLTGAASAEVKLQYLFQ